MKVIFKNTSLEFQFRELNWTEVTFNPTDVIEAFIDAELKWKPGYCYLIPATGIKKVKIVANSLKNAGFAMLRSNAHVVDSNADFCEGTARNVVLAGNSAEFSIPEDCQYFYVYSGAVPPPEDTKDQHLPASFKTGSYV